MSYTWVCFPLGVQKVTERYFRICHRHQSKIINSHQKQKANLRNLTPVLCHLLSLRFLDLIFTRKSRIHSELAFYTCKTSHTCIYLPVRIPIIRSYIFLNLVLVPFISSISNNRFTRLTITSSHTAVIQHKRPQFNGRQGIIINKDTCIKPTTIITPIIRT
jgi:hypothetical protein